MGLCVVTIKAWARPEVMLALADSAIERALLLGADLASVEFMHADAHHVLYGPAAERLRHSGGDDGTT